MWQGSESSINYETWTLKPICFGGGRSSLYIVCMVIVDP
jgi:hypothetical protein